MYQGKKIPKKMIPHILIGAYAHTLTWFATDVERIISVDEIELGEYDSVQKCAGSDVKRVRISERPLTHYLQP